MAEFRKYEVSELEEMDTLSSVWTHDLKVEGPDFRVYLDRTGEDIPVKYEILVCGKWYDIVPSSVGNWIINT